MNEKQIVMHVSKVSITVNILLSVLKFVAGIVAKSGAMISDAIHSASDVFSTLIVMLGVNISNKADDEDHQYGHERMESVAAVVLALILLFTGVGIGWDAVQKILRGAGHLQTPGLLALIAAVISIVVKEWMYWYTRSAGKKIHSNMLMADAWHHRSDALSSVGSFIGIFAARMGYPIMDPIASLVICLLIFKVAFDICRTALKEMVDHSCDEETMSKLREAVAAQEGVLRIDSLKTRIFAAKFYVDVSIAVAGDITVSEGHTIAENVHNMIEQQFPQAKHCNVHVNPYQEEPFKEEWQRDENGTNTTVKKSESNDQ